MRRGGKEKNKFLGLFLFFLEKSKFPGGLGWFASLAEKGEEKPN